MAYESLSGAGNASRKPVRKSKGIDIEAGGGDEKEEKIASQNERGFLLVSLNPLWGSLGVMTPVFGRRYCCSSASRACAALRTKA